MNIKPMILACVFLTACSTQSIRPVADAPVDSEISIEKAPGKNAVLTKVKAGKELKLVRIMEGGACNANQQGVVGLFSLYANPDDIDRIKLLQGSGIFASFESQIELFSMRALQQTVDHLNFQSDIHAQRKNDIQRQLADRFSVLFDDSIAEDISDFEAKTSLAIDVVSEPDSMAIYQSNCKTPHELREAVTNNIPTSLVFLSLLGSSQSAHRMTMLLLRRAKEK